MIMRGDIECQLQSCEDWIQFLQQALQDLQGELQKVRSNADLFVNNHLSSQLTTIMTMGPSTNVPVNLPLPSFLSSSDI
jgi:hypothetical protein